MTAIIDPSAPTPETYTALGWPVFPCHRILADGDCSCGVENCGSPGKHPTTRKGFRDATLDASVYRWTDRNVAIATGSGLHVIDVDAKAGAALELLDSGWWLLVDASGNHVAELPPSRVHRTGSGGWHWFGRVDGPLRNSSGSGKTRSLGLGIDSRGDGGYVLVPPSNHVLGEYTVLTDLPLADVPESILAVLRDPERPAQAPATYAPRRVPSGYAAKALASECAAVAAEPDGNRNNRLNIGALKMGQLVGAGLLDRGHVEAELLSAALAAGVAEHAARATIRSGLETGLKQPRQVPDRPREDRPRPIQPPIDAADPDEITQDEWAKSLLKDKVGYIPCTDNAIIILQHHPEWRGSLAYDEFRHAIIWQRDAPRIPVDLPAPKRGDVHQDHHSSYLQLWLGQRLRRPISQLACHQAIEAAAQADRVHPLQDYLNSLSWDGQPRVAYWLASYLGADETAYVDKVGRWWLVSAVARAMQPGCQVDHMLVLQGDQAAGKTSAIRILAGEYYLGTMPDLRDQKAAAESLSSGVWIVEIGELDSIRGASATRVKDFLTQTIDRYRPAYGRQSVSRPRPCVFVGTTNEDAFLTDPTGSRRYWPVKVRRLHRDSLSANRDQLWAEAVALYRAGAAWHPDPSDEAMLREEQEERFQVDEWEPLIAAWAATRLDGFDMGDVLGDCLGLDKGRWDRAAHTRVGAALHRLGFGSKQVRKNGARVRLYGRFPA